MLPDQQRLSALDRANIVAYLDGELTEGETRAIATKLTQSLSARREVEDLQRTWELLDHLQWPEAPPEFASRTVSQAHGLAMVDEQFVHAASRTVRVFSRLLVGLAICALSLGVSYACVKWLWPDRTARLVRDLSLAEHLDEYRDIDSFEFLKDLDESASFNRLDD